MLEIPWSELAIISDVREKRANILTGTGSKRSHSAPTRPVAIDVFNEHVSSRGLYCNALVLVRDFDVMDMNVVSPYVNSVESSFITPSDNHVIDLSTIAGVHHKMESRSYKIVSNVRGVSSARTDHQREQCHAPRSSSLSPGGGDGIHRFQLQIYQNTARLSYISPLGAYRHGKRIHIPALLLWMCCCTSQSHRCCPHKSCFPQQS